MGGIRRIAMAAIVMGGAALAVGGCGLAFNYLDDGLSRPDHVTLIQISHGGSGNVTVRADDSVTGFDVRRHVRYRGHATPAQTVTVSAATLVLNMDCGPNCSVSYEVRLPAGAAVRGGTDSGNISLSGVGAVDVTADSGNIEVNGAVGGVTARADSGNITLRSVAGAITATTSSGNLEGRHLTGGDIRFAASSGQISLELDGTGSATVHADSGDVVVMVPNNACRISAGTDSGNTRVEAAANASAACAIDARADSGNVTVTPV